MFVFVSSRSFVNVVKLNEKVRKELMNSILPEFERTIVGVNACLMICHSEDVCETVVADKRDRVSFNVDIAALSEELDAFSDRPVQVDKEILSNEDGITDSGGKLVIAVEIDAERRGEITAVGEGSVGWCDSFNGEGFARNGDFGVVRASESRGDLRLVVRREKVESMDVDVLARIASANGNDEVDVASLTEINRFEDIN